MKKIFFCFFLIVNFLFFSFSAYAQVDEDFLYDGKTEILLDTYENITYENNDSRRLFYEYTNYDVYDLGIVDKWYWLSSPYFIISVAQGENISGTKSISTKVNAFISGSYPIDAKKDIYSSFGISAEGSKKISFTISYSGPSESSSAISRDFYYNKGTHKTKVKIVETKGNNWDGDLSTKTYYAYVQVPAIKNYSENTY